MWGETHLTLPYHALRRSWPVYGQNSFLYEHLRRGFQVNTANQGSTVYLM